MGAGVLIAREESFKTWGVNNVWIRDNIIKDVQNLPPEYVPQGPYFTDLNARIAPPNYGRTGQAALEVHNVTSGEDLDTDLEFLAIGIKNIYFDRNRISNSGRNAIRVGADSFGGIENVAFDSNNIEGSTGSDLWVVKTMFNPWISCKNNTTDRGVLNESVCTWIPERKSKAPWGAEMVCNND